ncbi:MAG: hypothetical protein ACI7YS_05270 [Flavobacterium sp.]
MEEIENEYVKFWFENGILFDELKRSTQITKDIMIGLVELRTTISDNKKQYWCMDGINVKSIDKEARDYADKYGQDLLFATAALVNSHLTKFMFNTFLKLKNPVIPFQVFTKKEEAIEWLLEIKAKNENK